MSPEENGNGNGVGKSAWLRYLLPSIVTAILTAGMTYAAVRYELGQISGRQEMMIRQLAEFNALNQKTWETIGQLRERIARLEGNGDHDKRTGNP